MSAGCAHRLCQASNVLKLHIGEAVSLLCAFFFPISLPRFRVGHETAFSTDHGTDPKFDSLFLSRLFALLLHIYAFVYI